MAPFPELSDEQGSSKQEYYEKLAKESPELLAKKQHKNTRKAMRDFSAMGSAATVMGVTIGTTSAVHGPLAFHNVVRLTKHEWKSGAQEEAMRKHNVKEKKYKFGEFIGDLARGSIRGGIGVDAVADFADGKK